MATETFANFPSTAVSSGGTTAPAAGTVESWTVASSSAFPAASAGVTQFHAADPAASSELMLVTNVSGTAWTVTRGAENTVPVTHAPGFTVQGVVTAGTLSAFLQGTVSGQFLRAPSSYAPGTRASLTTSSSTMSAVSSGNVSTGNFTAPPSGSVLVTVSLVAVIATSNDFMAFALAAHGTVSPLVGNIAVFANNANPILYTIPLPVTGLTAGQTYNLDLMYSSPSSVTVTVQAYGQTTTAPGATAGAPVTMTVQAV